MAFIRSFTAALASACLTLAAFAPASAEPYSAGQHYEILDPAVATEGEGVEVVEVFFYGCGHCFAFEEPLSEWLATQPSDVNFRRLPAALNDVWTAAARAFYVAEFLGVSEKAHPALFDAFHKEHRRLRTADDYKPVFEAIGVSATDFDAALGSFAMEGRIKQAAEAARRYGITGVPSIIVAGKYRTSASQAGSHEEMLRVIEMLIEKERAAR
jgi:protein dithiol oxidoreductase (disulfide-forming)